MYWQGIKTYFRLQRNLTLSLDELYSRSWRAFQDLVTFTYAQVPFYRQWYDRHDFHPRQLISPADLPRVPKTRKALFQETDLSEGLASGSKPDNLVHRHTSGSTGQPLQVYYTPHDRIYRTLLHLRSLFHNGMTWRDRMVHLSDQLQPPDFRYAFQKFGFLPKEFICVAEPPHEQLDRLVQINPAVIYSYASNLLLLADEVEQRGSGPLHPKLIFTTGELLREGDRQRINQAFNTQLRDIFGLVEMGDVAWQCPAVGGYHLNIDSFLVEIEAEGRPANPGESGRLTITNLHSRAMPFIRYEVGDVLSAPQGDPCPCGCTFPRIDLLQGREDDWLFLPEGRRLSSMVFIIALIPGVRQYRIIQKAYDHLVVEILPGKDFSPDTLIRVKDHLTEFLGQNARIDVHPVADLPRQGGKIRSVIQEMNYVPAG